MLDLSKLKSGLTEYNFETFNLSAMLENLQEVYTTQHFANGFTFKLKSIQNVYIKADYKRIEQVIMNLLNNAINYSKENKEIIIELKQQTSNTFRLSIIDHGIGIAKENLSQIFDRHFRATNAKRVAVGSGIGLSIVKQILDAHKFEYGVISEEGKGSTFYINFKTEDNKGEKNET
jgi:signal transduction histidine kinase